MTTEEKLISMLQPKDYKSKIKLYCNHCNLTSKEVYILIKDDEN